MATEPRPGRVRFRKVIKGVLRRPLPDWRNWRGWRSRLARLLVEVRHRVPPGLRLFLGLLLIAGGLLAFLPGPGLWMLPLGIAIAALDVVPIWRWLRGRRAARQAPVTARVRGVQGKLLSDNWGRLSRYRYEYRRADGTWREQVREVYDRGHGAACLLYDPEADTVLLVRQFRFPMHVSGQDGFLIEVPAGLLDGAEPVERMRAELVEETGYEVGPLTHVTDLVMSPGSVTEYLACFTGTYTRGAAVGDGGGHEDEGEDIEVLHLPFDDALAMVRSGEIRDAKTCFLLQHLALKLGRPMPSP